MLVPCTANNGYRIIKAISFPQTFNRESRWKGYCFFMFYKALVSLLNNRTHVFRMHIAGRGVIYHVPDTEEKSLWIWETRWFTPLYWSGSFVKIIRWENGNFDLTLQKRRFCKAKEPLLPCKSGSFTMRNNRFWNVLIMRLLCDCYAVEKYLHFYHLLFAHKT